VSFVVRSVHLVRFVLVFLGCEKCVVLYGIWGCYGFSKENLTALWCNHVICIFFVEMLLPTHCYCSVSVVDRNISYCHGMRD